MAAVEQGTSMEERAENALQLKNPSLKRAAVIGRARGGKSFFISRFVCDKKGFVRLFCGNSKDKTTCPIHVKISEETEKERFYFRSDFNQKYSGGKKGDPDLQALNQRVSALLNRSYLQDDVASMKEIEAAIAGIRKFEAKYPEIANSNTYIDTHQKPSKFCNTLLSACGLGALEMVDTPGVSGKVEAAKISKSDLYIFLLKPDNSDEAATLYKIVDSIKADVATSKVIFLYKKEGKFLSKEAYEEARKDVHEEMAAYHSLFEGLKGNIISTDIDLLDPAGHCIAFPTMDRYLPSFEEDLFLEDIYPKMVEAFQPTDVSKGDAEFAQVVSSHAEAKDFVLDIMRKIPPHSFGTSDKTYVADDVSSEEHDRVMTKDHYRLHDDLNSAYEQESKLLDRYFSTFKAEDYPEEWKQIIIKELYRKLSDSVRTDRGLGFGRHPWEEQPARTMLVEESIFADSILANFIRNNWNNMRDIYIKTLCNRNISSATWNYVDCIRDEDLMLKLKIIKMCLQTRVSSRKEMILCRHIGGLRKIAQYKILRSLSMQEDECMREVASLPY